MTLVETGAEQIIGQFGVYVKIYPQEGDKPQNPDSPVFFDNSDNNTDFSEEKVRLYTSASEEIMKDYGLDETSDAVMYSTEDVATVGDKVKYKDGNYTWFVEESMTNQLGPEGPYIFIYTLGAV
jgi:hypothetical protein